MEELLVLIHDIIKTVYVKQGYLPDFPYHLISDEELFDAFLYNDDNYFSANYPCPVGLEAQYQELVDAMTYHITQYKVAQTSSSAESTYALPDWIYSYMIGATVGPASNEADRHDLFVLLGLDNLEDEFTPEIYTRIYNISQKWTFKLQSPERAHRPPTMFGEPHVIKSLRLNNA